MCTQIYPFLVVNVSISLLWFLGTDRCAGAAGEEPTGDFGGGNSALEPGEAVGDPQNEGFIMENPMKILWNPMKTDDLGAPPFFKKTFISLYIHVILGGPSRRL